jgi:hypothetical protein
MPACAVIAPTPVAVPVAANAIGADAAIAPTPAAVPAAAKAIEAEHVSALVAPAKIGMKTVANMAAPGYA